MSLDYDESDIELADSRAVLCGKDAASQMSFAGAEEAFLISEYDHSWNHYRHVETQRLQYLGFFFTSLGVAAFSVPILSSVTLNADMSIACNFDLHRGISDIDLLRVCDGREIERVQVDERSSIRRGA